ncbi:MAG: glycosyltransferase [Nibricoccus sp.]
MKTAVLINNYNHAPWLPACLDSVLAQTRPVDEIIVYDDASTDGSLNILQGYDPRITVIAGQNPAPPLPPRARQGNAIHQAFLRSTADVLFLLDSDDVFDPEKIEQYLPAFSSTPEPLLVQAPMRWIDEQGIKRKRYLEPFKHTPDPLAMTYATNDPDLFYPTSSLAFSRTFLSKALPIDWSDGINLWSDTRLSLAAMLQGPIVTLPRELGGWRHHVSSDSARQALRHTYQLRQTLRRTKVFNQLASRIGRPQVRVWQNHRLYRQLLRLMMPVAAFDLYQRWRNRKAPLNPNSSSA